MKFLTDFSPAGPKRFTPAGIFSVHPPGSLFKIFLRISKKLVILQKKLLILTITLKIRS